MTEKKDPAAAAMLPALVVVLVPLLGSISRTGLDMQVLEATSSEKMKDDSRVHHLQEEAMYQPKQRVSIE